MQLNKPDAVNVRQLIGFFRILIEEGIENGYIQLVKNGNGRIANAFRAYFKQYRKCQYAKLQGKTRRFLKSAESSDGQSESDGNS